MTTGGTTGRHGEVMSTSADRPADAPATRPAARAVPGLVVGALVVVAGLALALAFPEVRFLWFEGRPLGVVLAVVGALEIVDTLVRSRRVDPLPVGGRR